MEATSQDRSVRVHVDPCCPFAWITSRWLAEVERTGAIDLELRLMSLAAVNEHRELDAWYRDFNDRAWGPARVMHSVAAAHGLVAARRFYEAFGDRFHVRGATADDLDRREVAAAALADAGLPADLIDAADDAGADGELRAVTAAARRLVGDDAGTPIVELGGTGFFGPVLSSIPRGPDAVELFEALSTLAGQPAFSDLRRPRLGRLQVS